MPTSKVRPRVLVVEHQTPVLRAMVRLLQGLGAEAVPALGGRNALARLAVLSPPPDLVLTYLTMPDIDGAEILRHVRVTEALASIPVVAVTPIATDQPFDLILANPFLESGLREAIGLARRAREAGDRRAPDAERGRPARPVR